MLLGIDYGEKNVGIAITDQNERLALAFLVSSNKASLNKISEIVNSKNINTVILGYPQKLNELDSRITRLVESYIKSLKEACPQIKIITVDESLSTKMALQILRSQGYNSKTVLAKKDSEAARIILQTYIDQLDA